MEEENEGNRTERPRMVDSNGIARSAEGLANLLQRSRKSHRKEQLRRNQTRVGTRTYRRRRAR
ncbi:unnamed protein product [Meloidogyne enterolobii]|uniref:Uncharacterized protein n=1 Tax=Meloidogyne enterolobii TaxID=390850 RepID=A0ACB1AC70_MELEN